LVCDMNKTDWAAFWLKHPAPYEVKRYAGEEQYSIEADNGTVILAGCKATMTAICALLNQYQELEKGEAMIDEHTQFGPPSKEEFDTLRGTRKGQMLDHIVDGSTAIATLLASLPPPWSILVWNHGVSILDANGKSILYSGGNTEAKQRRMTLICQLANQYQELEKRASDYHNVVRQLSNCLNRQPAVERLRKAANLVLRRHKALTPPLQDEDLNTYGMVELEAALADLQPQPDHTAGSKMINCPRCEGAGHLSLPDCGTNEDLEKAICPVCLGSGKVKGE